jgi:pimeloyl-ACP methyl ester carboxylesterase
LTGEGQAHARSDRPTPLLFVHGAWHGAWCWDEYFLDFFAGRGYRALAVSLRGHGNSPTPDHKMLEPQWDAVAERVHGWLEARAL